MVCTTLCDCWVVFALRHGTWHQASWCKWMQMNRSQKQLAKVNWVDLAEGRQLKSKVPGSLVFPKGLTKQTASTGSHKGLWFILRSKRLWTQGNHCSNLWVWIQLRFLPKIGADCVGYKYQLFSLLKENVKGLERCVPLLWFSREAQFPYSPLLLPLNVLH